MFISVVTSLSFFFLGGGGGGGLLGWLADVLSLCFPVFIYLETNGISLQKELDETDGIRITLSCLSYVEDRHSV